MGMVIHDDMWKACKQLPEKQRAGFLYAVCQYGFEGVEPQGSPPWLFGFTLIKDRIDMGAKASEKGRAMARARWDKKNAPAPNGNDASANAQACAAANAQASSTRTDTAQNFSDAEVEVEVEVGVNPLNPPFWLQCLDAFNREFGQTCSWMPEACQHNLERHKDQFTVGQVAQMIAFMKREREGTQYENTLTPNTLFSLDHFEQYMLMAQRGAQKEEDYGIYDR